MDKTKELLKTIVEGLQEKKRKDIKSLDFANINNAVCKFFVICHGDSNTHVNALANSVEEFARERANTKLWRKEGLERAEWIVLDYSDIVVHIFQRSIREYYKLEDLWADCKVIEFKEN
ncbi:MAG: ribosome silencing factor [Bacteroidales bacterium]|nr:ribosome silencing factor [Bacteroidales bacterium]